MEITNLIKKNWRDFDFFMQLCISRMYLNLALLFKLWLYEYFYKNLMKYGIWEMSELAWLNVEISWQRKKKNCDSSTTNVRIVWHYWQVAIICMTFIQMRASLELLIIFMSLCHDHRPIDLDTNSSFPCYRQIIVHKTRVLAYYYSYN